LTKKIVEYIAFRTNFKLRYYVWFRNHKKTNARLRCTCC
jgi:hypothetical protein